MDKPAAEFTYMDRDFQEAGKAALEILAPMANAGYAMIPAFKVGAKSYFDHVEPSINLSLDDLKERGTFILGHETGHFIHSLFDSDFVNETYNENPLVANICEMVADCFGYALHFSNFDKRLLQNVVSSVHAAKDLQNFCEEEVDEDNWNYLYETHFGGSLAAKFLYEKCGTGILKSLVTADESDSLRILKELQYKRPLHFPFNEDNFFTSETRNGIPFFHEVKYIYDPRGHEIRFVPVNKNQE